MADPRPIGMLDSGVGGLSVLRDVRRQLPYESVVYVADAGHLPYGPRDRDEIRAFVCGIAQFLIEQDCKLIVIACNTANAAALHDARKAFPDLPIVGMEPAIKPAAQNTHSGVIGVLMTQTTYQSELYASVVDRFAKDVRVEAQVCPEFVTLVEHGAPDTGETRAVLDRYLAPLKAAGIDQLVLGCTHFPFLARQFQDYFGTGVTIVDPAPAVARQVGRVLTERQLTSASDRNGSVRYCTSGDSAHFKSLLTQLIHEPQPDVQGVRWDDQRLVLAAPQR
ncbi:MAG: glutamate racemase [Anaerolineae bacterium]|nr:glutamate racemase [Anaerolineae bacterium]